MQYKIKDINKILEFKTWSNERKIDSLLEMDADLYCNMGLETNKTQRLETKKKSRRIYHAIKQVDSSLGEKLLYFMD